jgi:ribose-phosphate pyrophosphokinase
VHGKTVIIFDDLISTGGTIVSAAKIMKELGADKVCAACVHPLLVGDAEKRIIEAGVEEIIGTDSVPSHVSRVSLAPLISEALKDYKSG